MHNFTKKKLSHVHIHPKSQEQKQSHLELFAQRNNKSRGEIFDRTLEENHSIGKFSTMILFINMSKIYIFSQETKSRGLMVI